MDAQDDTGLAISVGSGTVTVGGSFSAAADFLGTNLTAAGTRDGFLVRLDTDGHLLGARALGATADGAVTGLSTNSKGTVVATGSLRGYYTLAGKDSGSNTSAAFVLACDGSGADKWARSFDTRENDEANGVAIRADGHVFATGTLGVGTVDLGGGPLETNLTDGAFVVELDENGGHVCSRRYLATTTGEEIGDTGVTLGASLDGLSIATDAQGNVLVAGALTGKTTIGGQSLTASSEDAWVAKFAR